MASEVPRVIGDNAETRRFLDSITRDLRSLQSTVGGISPAPPDASYVTLGTNATLSAERVLTAGSGISLTDAGAGSTLTIANTQSSGGFFLLSSAVVGTGTSYSVTGLGGYKAFMILFNNVSHNNGASQTYRVAVSGDNGSSYGTAINILSTSFTAATLVSGFFFVSDVDQTNNQFIGIAQLSGGSGASDSSSRGPINALQFSPSGGNFDSGAINIYGLK